MTESGNGHFNRLADGLSAQQRLEFFQTLHEVGITAQDAELAQLLRVLQIYKAFYEEIPTKVGEALEKAKTLTADIKALLDSFEKRSDKAMTQLGQTVQLVSETSNQLQEVNRTLSTAIEKSTAEVMKSLDSALRKALSTTLLEPFEDSVAEIHEQCGRTASQAREMATQLKLAQRIHIGGYAMAAFLIALSLTVISWIGMSHHFALREADLLNRLDKDRQVLSELARRGAILELRRDPADSRKLYLIVNRAKAWTKERRAVVELTN